MNTAGTYIIYSTSSITLTATPTAITASAQFNGVLRVVKLNDPSHATLLDAHSSVYATSLAIDDNISGDTGTLTYTWTTVGTASNLLLLTFPHHRYAFPTLPEVDHRLNVYPWTVKRSRTRTSLLQPRSTT